MSNSVFNFNFLALVFSEIFGGPKFTLGGPTPLGRPYRRNFFTQSEYFTISNCVFNFNILALVVSDILGGPKFTLGGSVPPCTPPSGFFFVPQASTLLCRMAFLISTFYLFYFPRYQGGPKFTLGGPTPHGRPLSEKFFTQIEYFTISNCVFNFNVLPLVVSEILGGSQIYVRGPYAPLYAPQRKNLCT